MQIKHLDECSTTAGAVATVAQPFETVQKRAPEKKLKGSNLLKGIKTSAKYANSLHESEQVEEGLKFNGGIPDVDHMHGAIMRGGEGMSKVCPHCNGNRYSWTNYEQGKTPNHPWINPNTATLKSKEIPCPACDGGRKKVPEGKKVDRMVGHVKSSEKKLGKSSKEAENIAWATANKRGMLDNKNKKVEEGIGDTIKRGVKSVKRGMQGWGSPQDKPQEIVNRNKSYNNAELSTMRTKTPPPEHSPAGLQRKVIDREMKKRGLDEQGVAEADDKKEWQKQNAKPKQLGKTEKYFSTRHTTKDTGAADKEQGVAEGSLNESDKFTSWYDWKDQAKSSGYTITRKDDKIVALNKQGQVVGHWSDVGKFLSGKAPRPNFKRPVEQGVAEGSPQSMGTALANTLSKVEPGSKLDKKIRHHNDMVRRFGPEAGTMTSAPDGYRIDKKGFVRLGQGVAEGFDDNNTEIARKLLPRLKQSGGSTVDKCAALAAKYFNSAGLQSKFFNIDEYIKQEMAKEGVTEAEISENDIVLAPGKGRQYKPGLLTKPEVSVNPTDTVKLDVPLLIRLLEFAREDAKTDMDLHDLAEKLIAYGARGRTLTMKDYEKLVPEKKPMDEEQNTLTKPEWISKRKALQKIQMDPRVAKNPNLKHELMKRIAELRARAEAAGLLEDDMDESLLGGTAAAGIMSNDDDDFQVSFQRKMEVDEVSDSTVKSYLGKAMQDTITGKKDRNPGMKRAISRLAGNNTPLTRE